MCIGHRALWTRGYQIMHTQGAVPSSSGLTLGSVRCWKQTGLCLILQFPAVGVSFLVTWTLSQELPHCLEQARRSKSRKVTFTQWNVQVFPFILWGGLQRPAIGAARRSRSWTWGSVCRSSSQCCPQHSQVRRRAAATLAPGVKVFWPQAKESQTDHCGSDIAQVWCLYAAWDRLQSTRCWGWVSGNEVALQSLSR